MPSVLLPVADCGMCCRHAALQHQSPVRHLSEHLHRPAHTSPGLGRRVSGARHGQLSPRRLGSSSSRQLRAPPLVRLVRQPPAASRLSGAALCLCLATASVSYQAASFQRLVAKPRLQDSVAFPLVSFAPLPLFTSSGAASGPQGSLVRPCALIWSQYCVNDLSQAS